jgi:hypothetical protein
VSRHVWVLAVALVFADACSRGEAPEYLKVSRTREAAAGIMPASAPAPSVAHLSTVADRSTRAAEQAAEQAGIPDNGVKLIRSAELNIQVLNVERALRVLDSAARTRTAFVADARVAQTSDKRRDARVVIRVPSDRFDETLAALRLLGDVKSENISTEDVTKSYADLETRLAVSQATVSRLRALLATHTAKLTDVLEVERELSREIAEIEQMKGTRRFYDRQIAMSSITVSLFEPPAVVRPQAAAPIKLAFARSVEVLTISASWVVYCVTFVAPWVALAAGLWWVLARLGVRWPFRKEDRILVSVSPGG